MNIEVLLNSYIRVNYINGKYDTSDLNTIDDERNIITKTTNTGKELFIPLTSVLTKGNSNNENRLHYFFITAPLRPCFNVCLVVVRTRDIFPVSLFFMFPHLFRNRKSAPVIKEGLTKYFLSLNIILTSLNPNVLPPFRYYSAANLINFIYTCLFPPFTISYILLYSYATDNRCYHEVYKGLNSD